MVGLENLPPELWNIVLDDLVDNRVWPDEEPDAVQGNPDLTLKHLSLVSKFCRLYTLAALFRYVQVQQLFSQRDIEERQQTVLADCLDFIKQNGLQRYVQCVSFRVVIVEKLKGVTATRSADYYTDVKDWHIHRQTASIFEVVNPQTFKLFVNARWKKTSLVNALYLHQDVKVKADSNEPKDILLHQKAWTDVQLLNSPQDVLSSRHISMDDFNRRLKNVSAWHSISTPSLLKPFIFYKYQTLHQALELLPADAPEIAFPGLLTSLTTFTYFTPTDSPDTTLKEQQDEHDAVAWFLARNCPNLRHLRVKLSSRHNVHAFHVIWYIPFTLVIFNKPTLKTPKTFVSLDLELMNTTSERCLHRHVLMVLFPDWEFVHPNTFLSPTGLHTFLEEPRRTRQDFLMLAKQLRHA